MKIILDHLHVLSKQNLVDEAAFDHVLHFWNQMQREFPLFTVPSASNGNIGQIVLRWTFDDLLLEANFFGLQSYWWWWNKSTDKTYDEFNRSNDLRARRYVPLVIMEKLVEICTLKRKSKELTFRY
jgi:hypothetical protein